MKFNKGRALVTGGAGLIGSHLVDLLIREGYEVTLLDNLEPQTHPHGKPPWVNPSAHFIEGDIRDGETLHRALQGVRFVFHEAAFGGFTPAISKYDDVNVGGTAKIFELLSTGKYSVEKMVVASSQAVYAEGAYDCAQDGTVFPPVRSLDQLRKRQWELLCPKCNTPLRQRPTFEDKPKAGETPYALSKEFEERISLACGRQLRIPVVALRYAVTYGPRQSIFNPYTGVVSIFSTLLLNDLAPLGYEDGKQTRDFIYVGDVARANLLVMEDARADFQVFNVGTGQATSILGLAGELAMLYGKHIEPEITQKFRWGDVRHIILDPQGLNRLGFRPEKGLREGLKFFGEWIRSQGKVREYFKAAYEHLRQNKLIFD